ncbi:MAG: hypothetical protein Q9192_002591 [Flavoplaca navasiana]
MLMFGETGIVTKFDLYTTAQDRVWFELNQYAAAQMPQLLAALVEYEGAAEQDGKAGLIFSPTSNLTTVGLLYAASTVRPNIFRRFHSIPTYRTLVPAANVTLAELSPAFSSPVEVPTKFDIVAASTKVNLELYRQIYNAFIQTSKKLSKDTGGKAVMLYSLQPVTSMAVIKGRQMGGNAFGLSAEPQMCMA